MKERDSLNESTYFKRRVPSDIFEEYLNMTIDDFAKRYIKYKKKWNHLDDEKILIQIVSELMGELDFRLSNGGVDMYPFDEIYEFIIIKYKDKILETFYKVVKQYENTIKNNINENYNRLVDLVDIFMLENYPLFRKNKCFIKNNKIFDGFTYKPSEESDEWFAKYWLDDNELELNKKIYKTFEAYFGEKYLGAFLSWFNREFDVEAENIDF